MKYLSTSVLSIKENIKDNIKKIDSLNTDFIHLDIMDGIFVKNTTWGILEVEDLFKNHIRPIDVHLMVKDIKGYVDDFSILNPLYITFHYEATKKVDEVIDYIKSKNVKVGIAISPSTDPVVLLPYLSKVDLVLVMSVEPGKGGQSYIPSSTSKINVLKDYRRRKKLNYQIEVDGGINNETIKEAINADIFVVGSYITSNNYKDKINEIKNIIK